MLLCVSLPETRNISIINILLCNIKLSQIMPLIVEAAGSLGIRYNP